jgi:transcriptional regulator with XRE-family HTH domain
MAQARRTHFELRAAMRVLKLKQKDLVKACGVDRVSVSRWLNGSRSIPRYVWTILTFIHDDGKVHLSRILNGETFQWPIIREDVFDKNQTYRDLVKKWHPDKTGQDTTAEMSIINGFKKS